MQSNIVDPQTKNIDHNHRLRGLCPCKSLPLCFLFLVFVNHSTNKRTHALLKRVHCSVN